MPAFSRHHDIRDFGRRRCNAAKLMAGSISEMLAETTPRFPPTDRNIKAARIERLIEAEAWTDAALALIDLELPQWQVRRVAYDDGEWYCALSRRPELAEWLDQQVEARHPDLPLAIMSAFVEAKAIGAPATSVPSVSRDTDPRYEPMCCDNFG